MYEDDVGTERRVETVVSVGMREGLVGSDVLSLLVYPSQVLHSCAFVLHPCMTLKLWLFCVLRFQLSSSPCH